MSPVKDNCVKQFHEDSEFYASQDDKRLESVINTNTPEIELSDLFKRLAQYGVTDESYPIIETLKIEMSTQKPELSNIISDFLEDQRLQIDRQLEEDRFSKTSSPN